MKTRSDQPNPRYRIQFCHWMDPAFDNGAKTRYMDILEVEPDIQD